MLRKLFAALGLAGNKPTTSSAPAGELSASALVALSESGGHVLTIDGYSNFKAVFDTGKFVTTNPFSVGGHRWYMKYFPNGEDRDSAGYITFYLMREPDAGGADVSARFRIDLLEHDNMECVPWHDFHKSKVHTWRANGSSAWPSRSLVHRNNLLEGSAYLRDDCIRVRCDIILVSKEIITTSTTEERDVGVGDVPPPDVGLDILQLLWDGEGSDVSFEVAGEMFQAHSYIVAARSPVFMAELYGPFKESTGTCIRIEDMEPTVFRLLLDFIYTDWVPEFDEAVIVVRSQHLLVAADRYIWPGEVEVNLRAQSLLPYQRDYCSKFVGIG